MKNQSGSMPGNSCIFQLSIVHKNNSSLDCNPTIDVRGVLLNIYNAFDKGWHEGFSSNGNHDGIGGGLLNLFKDYLQEHQQRVVLEGQGSSGKQ